MEPVILFSGLVGAVGVLHLVTKGVETVRRYFGGTSSAQVTQKKKAERSDWYVFFAWNDLVGTRAKKTSSANRNDDSAGVRSNVTAKEVKRSSQRPAMRLSVQ